ncbi:hypothetical protein Poli38472_003611 [Pythium oligandrum]|uniref:Uncharacterized protein n=1 Tax=Pythium oligandrum TaxID=41045 RepID=A0A8K1CNG6_PYTOL|nr:hypothetical protein Poli38472_003611 [Pythium oligandrum]|eukprot:TMW65846.1 hypothetical protein Poli38472_003611 [Pythium oligandrum]
MTMEDRIRHATLPGDGDESVGGGAMTTALTKCEENGPAAVANVMMSMEKLLELLATKENELQQLQKTHDEYVKSSCEYEKELEAEVERYEAKTRHLEQQLHSMEEVKQQLHNQLAHAHYDIVTDKRREDALEAQMDEMKWKIQRLEQTNDELETATRVAQATIEELQYKVERLTEENVFLLQEREDYGVSSRRSSRAQSEDEIGSVVPVLHISVPESITTEVIAPRKISEATGPEPLNRSRSRRKSGLYPEVVESCLHMTCNTCQCPRRVSMPQLVREAPGTAFPSKKELQKPRRSFFERIRRRFQSE